MIDFLIPDWPAPSNVRALTTLRTQGLSTGAYASLNLGDHVGDDLATVQKNRQLLMETLGFQHDFFWLNQVHGIKAVEIVENFYTPIPGPSPEERREVSNNEADASFTRTKQQPCVVLTADCLPVLLCDRSGTIVAAVHAGWKGLLGGVIEATVKSMKVPGEELLAWMGPAIGPSAFEVDADVRDQFIAVDSNAKNAFEHKRDQKWLGDMFLLGRQRLNSVGVVDIYGGGECTYSDPDRFFSARRDKNTGRLASLIWIV